MLVFAFVTCIITARWAYLYRKHFYWYRNCLGAQLKFILLVHLFDVESATDTLSCTSPPVPPSVRAGGPSFPKGRVPKKSLSVAMVSWNSCGRESLGIPSRNMIRFTLYFVSSFTHKSTSVGFSFARQNYPSWFYGRESSFETVLSEIVINQCC